MLVTYYPTKIFSNFGSLTAMKELIAKDYEKVVIVYNQNAQNAKFVDFVENLIKDQAYGVIPYPISYKMKQKELDNGVDIVCSSRSSVVIGVGNFSTLWFASLLASESNKRYEEESHQLFEDNHAKVRYIEVPIEILPFPSLFPNGYIFNTIDKKTNEIIKEGQENTFLVIDPSVIRNYSNKTIYYQIFGIITCAFDLLANLHSNVLSDQYAYQALRLILKGLSHYEQTPDDTTIYEPFYSAAILISYAASMVGISLPFAMAFSMSSEKSIPVVQSLAPLFIETFPAMIEELSRKYKEIAGIFRIPETNPKEGLLHLQKFLIEKMRYFEVSETIVNYYIENDVLENASKKTSQILSFAKNDFGFEENSIFEIFKKINSK